MTECDVPLLSPLARESPSPTSPIISEVDSVLVAEIQTSEIPNVELIERTDDLDEIYTVKKMLGYKKSTILTVLYYILCIVSLGTLLLLSKWYPWLKCVMTHYPCSNVNADSMYIEAKTGGVTTVCSIKTVDLSRFPTCPPKVKMMRYRNSNYMYDAKRDEYRTISFDINKTHSEIHKKYGQGIDEQTRELRRILFGKNLIEVPVPYWFILLIDEVLHPFYIFQVFSIIVWLLDNYWIYATCIAVMSLISAIMTLIETRRNLMKLHSMATFICPVRRLCYQSNETEEVLSGELVPGDLIEIPNNFVLPCDVVLLSGQCVVNEAMLTGESIPVIKIPLSPENNKEIYDVDKNKSNTLYAGTKVIQTRKFGGDKVIGLVCKTGFETAKGKLICSIIYPKPSQFKFYRDSLRFIAMMFCVGMMGFVVSAIMLAKVGASITIIIKRALDVITIVVPPALPLAMTAGIAFAIKRLKESRIYCISPPRINVSGMINLMCFDKTGTLTEDGLDVYEVTPSINGKFIDAVKPNDIGTMLYTNEQLTNLTYALTTCHSLTYVNDDLIGDPLEVKVFEASNWILEEPEITDHSLESAIPTIVRPPKSKYSNHSNDDEINIDPHELGILRSFEFQSKLQRQSTIVRNLNSKNLMVFVKGSPEIIKQLSKEESLPHDYSDIVYHYAHNGYRVLAYAYKTIKDPGWRQLQKLSRDDIEFDLEFLGFIVMQNKVKKDTKRIIEMLDNAEIRNVMVTGDNPYTAISVSRECKLIEPDIPVFLASVKLGERDTYIEWKDVDSNDLLDPNTLLPLGGKIIKKYTLAVTGNAFEIIIKNKSIMKRVLVLSNVFARMSPQQKMRLIEEYQNLEYFVGMCGDGANDCGALKSGHIGISLSEAEASIAAPFTSQRPTIACVPTVIREGRAALYTSFQLFKYMSSYSFIQFFSVIILYTINGNLGDFQFLYVDLFIILPIAAFMGNTPATDELVKERPQETLISKPVLISLFSQLALAFLFQIGVYIDLHFQPWFKPVEIDPDETITFCYESTVIFLMSAVETFNIALSYSISKPFKKSILNNVPYAISLIIIFLVNAYLILSPHKYIAYFLEIMNMPMLYRLRLFGYGLLHLVISYLFEQFVILGPGRKLIDAIRLRKKKLKTYHVIHQEFEDLRKLESKKTV